MTATFPGISFGKLGQGMPMPHLLDIQTRAFAALLKPEGEDNARPDVGLERVFRDLFPITDVNENYSLEFVSYAIGDPKYSVEECIERDMTYSAPLKATLRLDIFRETETGEKRLDNSIQKEVYLGELPLLTPLGTFVINGAERVIVSQLHRSPGVVFEETIHPNGQRLFSARIIPFRGSWVEFTITWCTSISTRRRSSRRPHCCGRSGTARTRRSWSCSTPRRRWTSPATSRPARSVARCSGRCWPRMSPIRKTARAIPWPARARS